MDIDTTPDLMSEEVNEAMDVDEEDLVDILCLLLVIWFKRYSERLIPRQPVHEDRCLGNRTTNSMIYGHYRKCYDMCRLMPRVFLRLCDVLRGRGLLRSTYNVTVEEQVRMFLQTIGQIDSNRSMQHWMHHSGETVSRYFKNVLEAICIWSVDMIRPIDSLHEVPRHVIEYGGGKYWPFFRDCIGALDGTHVHAVVPKVEQLAHRSGRSKDTTQNVLVVCDFHMRFTFASAGWEGTAHDAKVLNHALYDPSLNFPIPPNDKYYLVDAGYPNRKGFLAPYKKTRYHIPHFQLAAARGKDERFNRLHSSLRNVIERSFGLLKERWPILSKMAPFPYKKQVKIMVAAMVLHNFIIEQGIGDELIQQYQREMGQSNNQVNNEDDSDGEMEGEDVLMSTIRDNIRDEIALYHGIL